MLYGLYLSASGVMANAHRQDVIANNLANSETVGFKRDLPLFQQRLTEAEQRRALRNRTNLDLEALGGGLLVAPTSIDHQNGDLEPTGRSLDVAIEGRGFLGVRDSNRTLLTRDGRLMVSSAGDLITAGANPRRVLDQRGNPIRVDPRLDVRIDETGRVHQNEAVVAELGLFDVPNEQDLVKLGESMFLPPQGVALRRGEGLIRGGFLERANVEPATELTLLLETQRMLEANANMIRYQDQMLSRLVNEVGKIG